MDHAPPCRLAYDIVDVFTDRPFAGNQLAVVHGADDLSTEQCQALAAGVRLLGDDVPRSATDGREFSGRKRQAQQRPRNLTKHICLLVADSSSFSGRRCPKHSRAKM